MKKKEMQALLISFAQAYRACNDYDDALSTLTCIVEVAFPPKHPPEWTPWNGTGTPPTGRVKVQYRRGTTSTSHDSNLANWKHAKDMPVPDPENDILAWKYSG